jgi:3'5'-cyclic nucleotide phosphodiesterase
LILFFLSASQDPRCWCLFHLVIFYDVINLDIKPLFLTIPQEICMFLESIKYQIFTLFLVFYSLFAYNIAVMVHAAPSADPWIDAFLILCMVVFASEITLTVVCNPHPPWCMVVLDTIATLSIIVDLSWVVEAANFDESNGSRTSQAAVVSARAGRIVRLVRLLRLLRTVSLLSRLAKRHMQNRKAAENGGTGGSPSNIGGKLTDALVIQVALVIIITVIATALLTSWGVQPSPFDAFAESFGAQAGATREELQPQVDAFLQFAKDNLGKQKPLQLRVGDVQWDWVEQAGGWPSQPAAAAEFPYGPKDSPTTMLIVNVSDQDAFDAMLDTLLIASVLVVLLFYVFALNVTIYKTLVRPLERIFNIIRNNAAQVVAALGDNNGGNDRNDEQAFSDEDGDIGTIEAAVQKMSRILQHATTNGRQGTHVARTLAADADNKTKAWLATMVGEGINEEEATPVPAETPKAGAGGSGSNGAGAAALFAGQGTGMMSSVMQGVRSVRFSLMSNSSAGSNSIAAAAAAAAAICNSPTIGGPIHSRFSGASLVPSTPGTGSRPGTGSFGALAGNDSLDTFACMEAFGGNLTPEQKEALLCVDLESLHSFKFDVLSLPREALTPHIVTMFIQLGLVKYNVPRRHSGSWETTMGTPGGGIAGGATNPVPASPGPQGFVEIDVLWRFVDAIAESYRDVPYHNLYHCVDVTHTTFLLVDRLRAPACLTPIECYAVMIAALAHDMDHPGVSNAFLVNARDSLALAYNDASVLENRHVACLYKLISDRPDIDVFKHLDAPTWKEVRRMVIAAILHTDMTQHFPMVSKLEVFLELKAADIQAAHTAQKNILRGHANSNGGGNAASTHTSSFSAAGGLSAAASAYSGGANQLSSVFSTQEERTLLLCCILHCADISNPARPAEVAAKWSTRVLAEFFAQGDREREAGTTVSPMCDRNTTSRATSQINFVEFVVAPLFSLFVRIFPDAGELLENASATRQYWQVALLEELSSDTKKPEEEKKSEIEKANTKVKNFQDKYADALALVSRRRRDLRRRLSTVRASAINDKSFLLSQGSHSHLSMSLAYVPVVPNSARSSEASSYLGSPHGGIGGASPSVSSADLGDIGRRPSLRSVSQSGSQSDMAKSIAAAMVSRARGASFRAGNPADGAAQEDNKISSITRDPEHIV